MRHTIFNNLRQGKASDYFVLILEGRVEVTVGKENLVFESGPFSHFGLQALAAGIPLGIIKINLIIIKFNINN